MRTNDIRVCILRMEGTNCEQETYDAFKRLGASPEMVHLKQLEGRDTIIGEGRSLEDYQILMFPGGFSAGDYIRAGAIFAARLKASIDKDLINFIDNGWAVGGFCNGFQIMVELGILPGFKGTMTEHPESVLHSNDSGKYECRPTMLKHVNKGKCLWTSRIKDGEIRLIPSAHAEGKFMFPKENEDRLFKKLFDEDRVVFRFCDEQGDMEAPYPYNPNGSRFNIAGITNKDGNVFGMMPHPERVFFRNTHPDWYRRKIGHVFGDGMDIFASILENMTKRN